MTKRSAPLDESPAVNSVTARLAVYVALAGAAGAGVAVALRRHNRKVTAAESGDPIVDRPASIELMTTEFHLDDTGHGASIKTAHDVVPPAGAFTGTSTEPTRTVDGKPGRSGTA
jgi:hypothetical protein